MKVTLMRSEPVGFDFSILTWRLLQFMSVAVVMVFIVGLFVLPDTTLFIIWKIIIPVVPLLLLVAPGFWRNLCPIAILNQLPRVANLGGNKRLSPWFTAHSALIGIGLLLVIVSCRKIVFNDSAVALACLLMIVLLIALFMGVRYKGKSGWCNSFCPMLPVEQLYGQTAFVEVAHSHCQTSCVGCTKHCSDRKPRTYYLSMFHNQNKRVSTIYLKLFVSIFPGFVLAYYVAPDPVTLNWLEISQMYNYFLFLCLLSSVLFLLIKSLFQISLAKMIALYGVLAFNIYYWFNASIISSHFPLILQKELEITIRVLVGGVSLLWILSTYHKISHFNGNNIKVKNQSA